VAFGEFLRIVMIKQTQIPFKLFAAQQIFFWKFKQSQICSRRSWLQHRRTLQKLHRD
jgi:hypothetical protein